MDSKRFWEIVDDINWGKLVAEKKGRGVDTGKVKVAIMRKYSRDEMAGFRDLLDKARYKVCNAIRRYNDGGGDLPFGGDSGDDLVNHVVGLGHEYYDKAIENTAILETLRYEESFAYVIPHDAEYETMKPGFFKNGRCKRFRDEALALLNGSRLAPIYAAEVAFLTGVVEKLEADDFANLPEPAIVRGYWKAIRDKVGNAEGKLSELRELDDYLAHTEWFLSNIVTDAIALA